MIRPKGLALLLFLALVSPEAAFPQERFVRFRRLGHLGARAASMGGAFTAVADDATAFHWNPAGYVFGPVVQVGFPFGESEMRRGDLLTGRGSLFRDQVRGFSIGSTFLGVAGTFSRQTSSVREEDLVVSRGLETFDLAVSILQSLPVDDLVIAANVHYLRGESHELVEPFARTDDLSASSIAERVLATDGLRSSTGSLDVALLYESNDWWRAGVMWRRITEPTFQTSSGEEIRLARHARAGVAFRLPARALLSFDLDLSRQETLEESWREVSFGGERRFFDDALSLRAGVRAELGSDRGARPAFTVGAGGRIRFLVADVAYLVAPDDRDEALWLTVTLSP